MNLSEFYKNKKAKSPSYYYNRDSYCIVSNDLLNELKILCKIEKKVVRICLHSSIDADLHNMLIAHPKGWYVRPHANLNKTKSYHHIEGEMLMIGFDKEQNEKFRFVLSKNFPICRLTKGIYIFLWPLSDICIFEEVAIGPFDRDKDTIFAEWSPKNSMSNDYPIFLSKMLKNEIEKSTVI